MNKRLIKKLINKREKFHGVIRAEGYRGHDAITIHDNCDGTIRIWVGHCCVSVLDKTVPVEFLTAILTHVMLEHDNDINAIIDSFDWNDEFKTRLKRMVN